MSAHDLEDFYITKDKAPNTYRIYMEFPVETTECWENLRRGKNLDYKIESSVSEILQDDLFEKIGAAFLEDKAASKSSDYSSGLKAEKGILRSDELTKTEKIKVVVAEARYIQRLSELRGTDNVSGTGISKVNVPFELAQKAIGMMKEGASMIWGAKTGSKNEDLCHVRIALLTQIDEESSK